MPTPTSNGALTNKGLICFSSAVHRWMLAIFVFSWLQAAMGLCEPSFSFHESWFWCPSFSPFFWLPLNFHCLVYFSLFSCGDQTTSKASQTQVTDVFFVFFCKLVIDHAANIFLPSAGRLETRCHGLCEQCS